MTKHGKAVAAFLTSSLAGGAVAFVAYLLFREPCPPIAEISVGQCVFGQSVGDFAQLAGLMSLLLGAGLAAHVESS